jgi:hypothetical protein
MTLEVFLDAIYLPLLILLWLKAMSALLPIGLILLGIIGVSVESKNGRS